MNVHVLLADASPAATAAAVAAVGDAPHVVVPLGDDDLGVRVVAALQGLEGPFEIEGTVFTSEQLARPVVTAARTVAGLRALLSAGPLRRLSHGPRPLLSASLIVKDEQTALPACLASLDGRVDELVVCDTGSTDRTVEIAEAFGARVVRTTWDNDFARARNVPLAACTGAWVLSVDADEQLVVPRAGDLRRALTPRGVPAYGVLIRNATDDAGSGPGFEHEAIRVFRREGLTWVGAVHESVADARTGAPPEAVRLTGVSIDHDGYLGTVYRERDKAARNLALAEKDHEAALSGALGRTVAKTAYELARALSLQPGTDERQEELLRLSLAEMPPGMGRLQSSAALRLAGLLRRTGRPNEAVPHAQDAVRRSPSDPSAAWELAEALLATGRPQEALEVLERWRTQPLQANEAVSRTAAVADLAIPASRARALVALGRDADAADVLLETARHEGFDQWAPLYRLLRDTREDWADALASACPSDAFGMLAALDGIGDDRSPLLAALRARGIDPAAYAAGAGFRTALADALVDKDPEDVARAALALEESQPHLAMQAWLQLSPSGRRQVALARCHLALDDLEGAFAALDDLDIGSLDPPDLLTVALLAAHAGDADTAHAVLDALPPDLGDLQPQADGLRAALPARVVLG